MEPVVFIPAHIGGSQTPDYLKGRATYLGYHSQQIGRAEITMQHSRLGPPHKTDKPHDRQQEVPPTPLSQTADNDPGFLQFAFEPDARIIGHHDHVVAGPRKATR